MMILPKGITSDMVCENLFPMYQKFLFVNLTTGKYKVLKVADDEAMELSKGAPKTISDYWGWFVKSELIHEEDVEKFLEFASNADANKSVMYRRKLDGEWKQVVMRVIATSDYTPNNRECMLYICDIDSIYRNGCDDVAEKICSVDNMTGLRNGFAFERDKHKIKSEFICVLFADVNGLKYTNDNYGHQAGNELIKKFANLLALRFGTKTCYHISGDEFIVTSDGQSAREFLNKALELHKGLWNTVDMPIASIGYAVGEASELDAIIADADRQMQADKRIFYTRFPKFERK